jgi:hypothetical protein
MPTGSPLTLKCPKCRRGQYWKPPIEKGVRATGVTEGRVTMSAHMGHGNGGPSFYGYRGEAECLDCGHKWFSTHPQSGRMYSCRCCTDGDRPPDPNCKRCNGTGKVRTFKERWG